MTLNLSSYNLEDNQIIRKGDLVYLKCGAKGNFHVTEKDGSLCVGEGLPFQRIRRVTGYLTGDISRFNNGKKAEEKDRVKHLFM